jgi:hypothetical protein
MANDADDQPDHLSDDAPTGIRNMVPDDVYRAAYRAAERSHLVRLNREAIERSQASVLQSTIAFPSVSTAKGVVFGGGSVQFQTLIALVALVLATLYALPPDVRAPIVQRAMDWLAPARLVSE